ncbi:MAG: hypothetical protein C0392_04495 [Syntrophus sp. (in: bacteria)]|nr:hypothetical protein [Syntrophus sp. (in: bacteria)]
MDIKTLQKRWDEMGRDDPLWAILGAPDKRGRMWQVEKFFKTGVEQINEVMHNITLLEHPFRKGKALDFGCGVGRLTQPLADYFDEVHGIDIAPSMIELANAYNRFPDKCSYHLNNTDDLRKFDNGFFDFIYSYITLQHIAPQYTVHYIKEFLRVLAPDGLLLFQLPSESRTLLGKLKPYIRPLVPSAVLRLSRRIRYGYEIKMEMYGINKNKVIGLIEESRGKIIKIEIDRDTDAKWNGFIYYIAKNG